MSVAHDILNTPDRTAKERRQMAEIRHIGPVDWKGDILTCRFVDGSSLMMVLDSDLAPVEFLPL